ncbi:hypothetical protein HDK77DRAFT_207931 [Phyllosticta capitalensis]|uniref:Uncharacterized protein n=1 Tax=Phyllosticta capitalensis TaxID=121624 RepID=A0ABR1Z339_9PEZI
MPIDWKSPESYKRLLAAMCAAQDNNIDFKKVAYYFGQGATYDSIEGRFRIAKKLAQTLEKEAVDEGREMPTTRTKSATSTPRKPKAKPSIEGGVVSGRVTKASPKKKGTKNSAPTIKTESDSASSTSLTPSSTESTESELQLSYDGSTDFSPYTTMDAFTTPMSDMYVLTPGDITSEL